MELSSPNGLLASNFSINVTRSYFQLQSTMSSLGNTAVHYSIHSVQYIEFNEKRRPLKFIGLPLLLMILALKETHSVQTIFVTAESREGSQRSLMLVPRKRRFARPLSIQWHVAQHPFAIGGRVTRQREHGRSHFFSAEHRRSNRSHCIAL